MYASCQKVETTKLSSYSSFKQVHILLTELEKNCSQSQFMLSLWLSRMLDVVGAIH